MGITNRKAGICDFRGRCRIFNSIRFVSTKISLRRLVVQTFKITVLEERNFAQGSKEPQKTCFVTVVN